MSKERELAKVVDVDIQDDEHGGLILGGHFKYEGGSQQGLGYNIDVEFIKRFMDVFGVSRLRNVNGKSCWVTHDYNGITKIEPLHKGEGQPFVIDDWSPRKKMLAEKR